MSPFVEALLFSSEWAAYDPAIYCISRLFVTGLCPSIWEIKLLTHLLNEEEIYKDISAMTLMISFWRWKFLKSVLMTFRLLKS